MGLWDYLFGTSSTAELAREVTPPFPSVQAQIRAYVEARYAGGTFTLPAVERGVELIASLVGQLRLVAYRDAVPMTEQPRIVARPDPWATSPAFWSAFVRSMLETGDGFAFLFDHDPESGRPRAARVIPSDEVSSEWDDARFLPRHKWRGRDMTLGVDLLHVPLSPRAGELRGRSPLVECRRALLAIEAAELYAAGWFEGSGIPSGILTSPTELTDTEADALLASWLESHTGPVPTPAVLSGGLSWQSTAADPERSQLTDVRDYGVATVARLLGIPAPLLLVNLHSSSLTYQNAGAVVEQLVKSTVAPMYLAPIEAAWSDLVPRGSSARFDLGELGRLDYRGRLEAYRAALELELLTIEDVKRREGVGTGPTSPSPFDGTSSPAVPAPEVPA
jgi:HK97 family phage portal protein